MPGQEVRQRHHVPGAPGIETERALLEARRAEYVHEQQRAEAEETLTLLAAARAAAVRHQEKPLTVGLIFTVPLFLLSMLRRARKIHDDAIDHDFVVVVWAIFVCYLTNAMFMEPRFYEFMNVLPFLMAGIVVGSYQRKQLGNGLSPI